MISRYWVCMQPVIVMSQIGPLFLVNRSAFISRIFIYVTNPFTRDFLSGYVFSQVQFYYSQQPPWSESSSRIYSPYVFALGQLIGEIPYSIVCGVLYWVLMVCIWVFFDRGRRVSMRIITLQVFPMGFGQGSVGVIGTGFQLLVIIFMLLFGVTLGQMVAALSPSVQVGPLIHFSDAIWHCIIRWLFYSILS